MTTKNNKLMPLEEAIRTFVRDGSHISVGGFTVSRNPMAATFEIIRQGIGNLHCYAHSNGTAVDELVGAGCLKRLEIAYAGVGKTAPTCIRFRQAVQKGTLEVEDYSNYQMTLRFHAGAMGVPFLPTRSGLGSEIMTRWGFDAATRQADDRLPNQKLTVMDNPFSTTAAEVPKVVLVPAITPDVTLLHVQQADAAGTCRIFGLTFADVDQARAAKHVIVTCEELVEPEVLRAYPEHNQIPFIHVSAVVHVPYGAYPSACYRYYDYDPVYQRDYARWAKDDKLHQAYLDKYVYGVANHQGLLDLVGPERLQAIQADPRTGYAVNLDRR